ncbi:RDD family protein [Streptomyces radicis]|uniref:DUF2510 domain-containing protein n=1 Tax=Streptomyces radicis TaxID=1750517 RepID=A0A3A9WEI3_9ACTN|nr:RDD family protein [Streptomyces radicis]RKN07834.1 DUF2510 domain-containing protein [Streptomyces radicis]RKN20712.1 DUF2510 domain-containing protein [Streptomyces radicis]
MSSPPAGPNWYPDPSIPGYIRYWNGTSWVPGSSRPEPREGEPVPSPPSGGAAPAPPAATGRPVPAAREGETQPFFFDEDPPSAPASSSSSPSGGASGPSQAADDPPPSAGSALPEPRRRGEVEPSGQRQGGPWGGDAGPQQGGRGEQRVTWGSDEDVSTSPVVAAGRGVDPRGQFRRTPSEGSETPARRPEPPAEDPKEQTTTLRRADIAAGGSWERQVRDLAQQSPPGGSPQAPPAAQGGQSAPPQQAQPLPPAIGQPPVPPQQSAPPQQAAAPPQAALPQAAPQQAAPPQQPQPQAAQPQPAPGYGYPPQQGPAAGGYGYPQQQGGQQPGPSGGGYGYPQQGGQPAPQQSPFLQSHQGDALTMVRRFDTRQAYPAKLGKRLVARVVDSLLPGAAAAVIAAPLVGDARDHIQDQVDAAERAGVTETIWLIDGTTGGYLALVLGVFLGVSLLLEALPVALWGTTLGKAIVKLRVLDVGSQEKPGFGAALLRWLLYNVLAVFVVGIVSLIMGARDRPWRQAWHDKAAQTFVGEFRAEGQQPRSS